MKSFFAAASLTVAAFAFSTAPAHAQVTINIGRPAPQYVVVHEVHTVKKYKAPKCKKGAVMLVPARPVYYVPREHGHGHGHGHGKGRH